VSALILAAGLIALAFELQNVLSWWRGRVLEAASVATRWLIPYSGAGSREGT
jgi:hypothetical protein